MPMEKYEQKKKKQKEKKRKKNSQNIYKYIFSTFYSL